MKLSELLIIGLVGLSVIIGVFAIGNIELGFLSYFKPKRQNIEREVFKNTNSFVEGKIQELSNHYSEYLKSSEEKDKEAIKNVVSFKFSNFDIEKIESKDLQKFLKESRGF